MTAAPTSPADGSSAAWFGDRAVLVRVPEGADAVRLAHSMRRRLVEGGERLVVRPGLDTVLIAGPEPDPRLLDRVRDCLVDPPVEAPTATGSTVVPIAVRYDGADLQEAAARLGCTVPQLVDAHGRQEWTVAMMGFAPGFGYLVPAGEPVLAWSEVPRLDRPRTRVPAGSVALAAGMSAVYPAPMPGGWLLLGTTQDVLFDARRDPPATLAPGSAVRFVAVRP